MEDNSVNLGSINKTDDVSSVNPPISTPPQEPSLDQTVPSVPPTSNLPPTPPEPLVPPTPPPPILTTPPPPLPELHKVPEPSLVTVNQGEPKIKGPKSKNPFLIGGAIFLFLIAASTSAYFLFQKGKLGFQRKADEQCVPTSGIGDDGPGGCCGVYSGTTDGEIACEGNSGDCSSTEVCDVGNGACASGLSCRASQCFSDNQPCTDNWQCCSGSCNGGTCSGSGGNTPPPSSCTPTITYLGATTQNMDCSQGSGAAVTIRACVATGCPATSIVYNEVNKTCNGPEWAGCGGACGDSGVNKTLAIPAGDCAEASVSCSAPDCGSCQVDINDYGVRRWNDTGCSLPTPTQPVATATPTVPPPTPTTVSGTPMPTPTGVLIVCSNLQVAVSNEHTLENLSVSDNLTFTVNFTGTVEDVAVVIKKNGARVAILNAGASKTSTWVSEAYTITGIGSYEAMALIKLNGNWQ